MKLRVLKATKLEKATFSRKAKRLEMHRAEDFLNGNHSSADARDRRRWKLLIRLSDPKR